MSHIYISTGKKCVHLLPEHEWQNEVHSGHHTTRNYIRTSSEVYKFILKWVRCTAFSETTLSPNFFRLNPRFYFKIFLTPPCTNRSLIPGTSGLVSRNVGSVALPEVFPWDPPSTGSWEDSPPPSTGLRDSRPIPRLHGVSPLGCLDSTELIPQERDRVSRECTAPAPPLWQRKTWRRLRFTLCYMRVLTLTIIFLFFSVTQVKDY